MAVLQIQFYSNALCRLTTFHMIMPNDVPEQMRQQSCYDRPMKSLYLLHGFSGSSMDWMLGCQLQELAAKYNLAIILPSGENSFYLNQRGVGRSFETYVGKEIVSYIQDTFQLSKKKEDTYIGGLSMGGFGAIHTGIKYSEIFGKCFGLSSAMIIHNIKTMKQGDKDAIADYDYYEITFGPLDQLENTDNNPEYLIHRKKENKQVIPPIYMACGTEDFLLSENRKFHQFLLDENIDICYEESEGSHDWKFWNDHLEPAIQWLLK